MTEQEKENYVRLVNAQYLLRFTDFESASKFVISVSKSKNAVFYKARNIGKKLLYQPAIEQAAKAFGVSEWEVETEIQKAAKPKIVVDFEEIKELEIAQIKSPQKRRYNRRKRY
jgi:hypothetical protein